MKEKLMATMNDAKIAETAEVLLDAIKRTAADSTHPTSIESLARAFALVAGGDPKEPGRMYSM